MADHFHCQTLLNRPPQIVAVQCLLTRLQLAYLFRRQRQKVASLAEHQCVPWRSPPFSILQKSQKPL